MLEDPEYGRHQARVPSEHFLICAILSRAILDLFGSATLAATQEERAKVREESLLFLTRDRGSWANRRNELCDAVGIDGDEMRKRVIQVLEGNSNALDAYASQMTHMADARKLWADRKDAKARAQVAREKQSERVACRRAHPKPKLRNQITDRAKVREILLSHLDQPMRFKDLLAATNGDLSDSVMRNVLKDAVARGEITRHPETFAYRLAPKTAVAAAAA